MSRLLDMVALLRRMNWTATVALTMLLAIGVLFVYSASYASDMPPVYGKQAMWIGVGVVCYLFFAAVDYRHWGKMSWWVYAFCLALLVLVLVMGRRIYGAKRWLMPFGESGLRVQPSELAKLATMILAARVLSGPMARAHMGRTFLLALGVMLAPMALIVLQPDFGTAMIFPPVVFLMMFVGEIPMRYLGALAGVGILAAAFVLGALVLPEKMGAGPERQERWARMTGLSEYQRNRILVFVHSERDPLGTGWNKRQSEIAVGSGGKWGKGFGRGTQNILGFLPRSVAPTDFVYSVIAEETGFFGSAVVLGLFAVLSGIGIWTAFGARDAFGRLLCTGVAGMVFLHAFVNMAMTVGLLPITGLPLPFLSYGGSFMVVMMSTMGIMQSVSMRSRRTEDMV